MIQVHNIGKRFRRLAALDDVSFEFDRNRTLVVLGPSGCGKTTMLRLVAGLESPDGGRVLIDGELANRPGWLLPPNRRQLSMIFQDLALWPHMTAFENVAFGLRDGASDRRDVKASVEEILDQVGLIDHRHKYPTRLSGGERQRLAVARALAVKPRYILMDEPFSSLDPLVKEQMLLLLRDLQDKLELGILFVTHNLDETLALGGRVMLMQRGKVVGRLEAGEVDCYSQADLLEWYKQCLD
jgi:iron(III) transport system ATP-binding protein